MSSPTPGRMPTYTPITPERRMVLQYRSTSPRRGRIESTARTFGRAARSLITVSTSAQPKAPTSVGISDRPPARSGLP